MVVVAPASEVVEVVAMNAAYCIQGFSLLDVMMTTRSIVRLHVDMIVAEMVCLVVLTEIVKLLRCLKTRVLAEGDVKGQLVLTVWSVEAINCSETVPS